MLHGRELEAPFFDTSKTPKRGLGELADGAPETGDKARARGPERHAHSSDGCTPTSTDVDVGLDPRCARHHPPIARAHGEGLTGWSVHPDRAGPMVSNRTVESSPPGRYEFRG